MIPWAVTLAAIGLAFHGLWISPNPNHQFILQLIATLGEDRNSAPAKKAWASYPQKATGEATRFRQGRRDLLSLGEG